LAAHVPDTAPLKLAPLLVAGAVLRLLWLSGATGLFALGNTEAGEATRVAFSLALGHGFAGAFPGMGATAHLLPLSPLVAGALLRLFGIGTPMAALALTAWALAQAGMLYLLLARLFRELGLDHRTLRAGVIALCLVPLFAPEETVSFRYWEGALGACCGALALTHLLRLRRQTVIRTGQLGWAAAITAFAFFVSPPVGLATGACWATFAVRHLPPAGLVRFLLLMLAAFAAWMVPWTLRNAEALGEPIPIRSNFGLELAIGNHEQAVSGQDPAAVFKARLLAIHPYHGREANLHARAVGEVAYSKMLGDAAKAWIRDNPTKFLRLCARHYFEFFFPRSWQFEGSQNDRFPGVRSFIISLVNALGILGLAFNAMRKRPGHAYLALYIALVALPYALVQPVPRYSYLVYGLLSFLAVGFVRDMVALAKSKAASPPFSTPAGPSPA